MLILVFFCQDIYLYSSLGTLSEKKLKNLERTRNITREMFSLFTGDVLCDPDKVFELFVDIDGDLSMSKDANLALVALTL